MPGQNNTKGNTKLLIAQKARIRACPDQEATGTAITDHLGRQKLTKENLISRSVSMPRRITGIIKSGGNMT
jgi:hypothetical protein